MFGRPMKKLRQRSVNQTVLMTVVYPRRACLNDRVYNAASVEARVLRVLRATAEKKTKPLL